MVNERQKQMLCEEIENNAKYPRLKEVKQFFKDKFTINHNFK